VFERKTTIIAIQSKQHEMANVPNPIHPSVEHKLNETFKAIYNEHQGKFALYSAY
jgi:hypothetical protein